MGTGSKNECLCLNQSNKILNVPLMPVKSSVAFVFNDVVQGNTILKSSLDIPKEHWGFF